MSQINLTSLKLFCHSDESLIITENRYQSSRVITVTIPVDGVRAFGTDLQKKLGDIWRCRIGKL
jgi:hypothetical protein